MKTLSQTPRIRQTPFSERVEEIGVKAYTVYNHMLLPTVFRTPHEDYKHLKSAVQVWDVSVERQVELVGPDAAKLIQMTTPRDLSRMQNDQCYYIPNVDKTGGIMNDPVAIRLDDDRYWVSLADSDMLFYYMGLAAGFGLDVEVFEPDVYPLAIQGPLANQLIERVFGQEIVDTKFFRHKTIEFNGQKMIIARSGWSLQGGFEIYMEGWYNGIPLWDTLFEAGKDLDVYAGCPNGIERIEGGMLSYGSDMTMAHTPFDCGLGKFVHFEGAKDCLGMEALTAADQNAREICPIEIEGEPLGTPARPWRVIGENGTYAGRIASCAYSPDYKANVSIGMIEQEFISPDVNLTVFCEDETEGRACKIVEKFWLR
ncbi:MAG: dimethylsulfoniopropionate demethylase [Pseudomonadota bacterium]